MARLSARLPLTRPSDTNPPAFMIRALVLVRGLVVAAQVDRPAAAAQHRASPGVGDDELVAATTATTHVDPA